MLDCCPRTRGVRGVVVCVALAMALAACGPRPVNVVIASGDKAAEREQYQLAEAEYREAIDRRPGQWRARLGLAKVLLEQERYAEAQRELEVVYAVRPNDPEVLDLLGEAMVGSGDVERMTAELRHVAEDRQGVADWVRLGRLLNAAGDSDGARTALVTAAKLDKGQTIEPQLALADFYQSIGDGANALKRYRMALWIDLESEAARNGIRSMGEVPGPSFVLRPTERAAGT